MTDKPQSSDETNPCHPIDGERCPDYWRCFDACGDDGDTNAVQDRLCNRDPDHEREVHLEGVRDDQQRAEAMA